MNPSRWADGVAQAARLEGPESSLWMRLFTCERHSGRHFLLVKNLPFESRHRFIRLLGRFGDRNTVLALQTIDDLLIDDLLIEIGAAKAVRRIGRFAPAEALALLLRLADARYPVARVEVARAFGSIADNSRRLAMAALQDWCRDERPNVRESCARALAQVADQPFPQVKPLFRRLLGDPIAAVRLEAIRSLSGFIPEWTIEAGAMLLPATRDGRWSLREAAARALGLARGPGVRHFAPVLLTLCMDPVLSVAVQSSRSIAQLAARERDMLADILQRMAIDCGYIAAEALMELIRVLRTAGTKAPKRAIAILSHLGKDADAEIRAQSYAAIQALHRSPESRP
jgi:HEAT repeat protein